MYPSLGTANTVPFLKNQPALGRPREMGWGGMQEGGSGWGTHVNPWLIYVNVWQKPLQYCTVIRLQLIKINEKKKSTNPKSSFSSSRAEFKESWEDFPGILVAKIPCFQCRGPEVLMQRTRSHMLQLRVYMLNLKISCASTKTRHGQRNIFFFFLKREGWGFSCSKETIHCTLALYTTGLIWAGVGSLPLAHLPSWLRAQLLFAHQQ